MTQPPDLRPTERFSDRAADYVRFRPTYPVAALRAALEGLGDPEALVAADVGAGTGISARLLASLGPRVIAVEPNAAMRSAAEPHPRVLWRDARAETTGLVERSVDLVLCAQAFHWFASHETLAEFRRILRPRGRLALMWNQKDDRDPFTKAYYDIVDAAAKASGQHLLRAETDREESLLRASPHFVARPRRTFPNAQSLDEDSLVGRAMSASYAPKEGPASERMVRDLRALHRRHRGPDGLVPLVYETELYLADASG